jgi:hypothetical protein
VLGVPGRVSGWVCRCGVTLADDTCPDCGATYALNARGAVIYEPDAS